MILGIVKEFFLVIYYPFASIANIFFRGDAKKTDKKTIVMVERWFNSNPMHKFWKRYLEEQGFDVYLINFPIYKGTFEKSAALLAEYIESLNLKNFTLVGISSGGITSLLYLEQYKGWEKADKFISLGAPFKGTPKAFFISFVKSGFELLPGSGFMRKFKNLEITNKNKIICLRAKMDEMVPDWSSSIDGTRTETLDVIGHNKFHLDSKETYEKIRELLT